MRSTASHVTALFSHSLGAWALLMLVSSAGPAHAQFVIIPNFDASITGDAANRTDLMNGVNAAIAQIDAVITNNLNGAANTANGAVNITFSETNMGLAGSTVLPNVTTTYAAYVNALMTKQTLSANDGLAIASLNYNPLVTMNNPVNANANIIIKDPLARVLGLGGVVASDGQIFLNPALMKNATPPGAGMDFTEGVAEHEIDEVLGIGGAGSQLRLNAPYAGQGQPAGAIGPLDLYRYDTPPNPMAAPPAAGVRSYSLDPNAKAPYFSITGGANPLVNFNQNGWVGNAATGSNADFGDWGNGTANSTSGNTPPQVQDAFGVTNMNYYLGTNEVTALDVVGYNVSYTAVPEPGTLSLVGAALAAAGFARRRRAAAAL